MAEFEWLDEPKITDINLAGKAIRNRYNVSDDDRAKIIGRLVKTALDPEKNDRTVNAAIRAILAAEKIDIDRDKLDIDREKLGKTDDEDIWKIARTIKELDSNG